MAAPNAKPKPEAVKAGPRDKAPARSIAPDRTSQAARRPPASERGAGGAASVASDAGRLQLLLNSDYGLMFLIVFAAEFVVGGAVAVASSGPERVATLGIFAALLVITMFFYARLRQAGDQAAAFFYARLRQVGDQAAAPSQAVVPANLTQAPTQPPAGTPDELMNHIDGTFAIARPPANWALRFSSPEKEMKRIVDQQRAGEATPINLPYKPGPLMMLEEQHRHAIRYVPGQSTQNGRPIIGALDEHVANTIAIFSVSKAGTMIRDITPEHLFALLLAQRLAGGDRVTGIREAQLPAQEGGVSLTVLHGTTEQRFERVGVDGGAPQDVTLEGQLQIVERAEFMYVIASALIVGAPEEEARRREMETIIASVNPRRAADAVERGRAERHAADATWMQLAQEIGPRTLGGKAAAIAQTLWPQAKPAAISQAAIEVAQLAAYGTAMPDMVPAALTAWLHELLAALRAAEAGSPAVLHALLTPPADPQASAA